MPGRPRKIYRSARTGQFVRNSVVKRRPSTTVTETVKPKRRGKK